ncbi:ATPase [Rheinheimera texasensis]|uniref:ATPase n=1 Tax=Rheinheimera texasensis TaxID=306205 RepID=UPI00068931D3|nr:ATPase [Rheinheimera texasensis]
MSELYGLTKLALLNTAGYAKCVIPLDDAASICAPNNTGKSSVINALQFPLINDLRLTEWDGHDLDETRKFYFGTDQSYILLEANLPEGPVVIGVAGLGKIAGYQFQYFCYRGKLDLTHYVSENSIIRYNKLDHHLRNLGFEPLELKPSELNAMLTGGATPYDSKINLRMIPLTNVSDAPVYKDIFRRILNLHRLTAQDVKRLLLPVFARHLSDPKVDFYTVWHNAFEKVNRDRRELKALENQQQAVEALENLIDNRAVLKGRLAAYAPKLDKALIEFQSYLDEQQQELGEQLEALAQEKHQLEDKQRLYVGQIKELSSKQLGLKSWFDEHDALAQRFGLTNLPTLQSNLANIRAQYESLSHSLQGAANLNPATLAHQQAQTQKQLKSLKLQLKNLEYNLYSRLREDLSLGEVQQLTKLLNPDLLSLSTASGGDVVISDDDAFAEQLGQIADAFKGGKLHLAGATIDLSHLTAPDMAGSEGKVALKEQIEALQLTLATLDQQAEVAVDFAGKSREKERLYQDMLQAEEDLKRFARYSEMAQLLDEQQLLSEQLTQEEEIVHEQLAQVQQKASSLSDRRNLITNKQDQLKRQLERIEHEKKDRIDFQLDFYSGRVTPYPIEINLEYDNLADELRSYNKHCQELKLLEINIKNTYLFIFNAGISKFEAETDEEAKYQKLISAFHHLDKEREAIERRARVALTEVASTLKGLRSDLDRLHRELNSFNRGIWRHQISNLQDFKIEIVDRKILVGHIDTILTTSDAYQQGDTLDLLAPGVTSAERDINSAKDYLIQAASEKGGLTLSDLFDIRFKVVNRAGEVEFFDKIDSAGSNGTRITIKLLCGMLFIRQLLAERERGKYRIPIYIDEAADIDPHNQQALIETALNFGFVPIFASVKPQTSCRYIVPIRTVKNGAQNWVDEKDWIICEQLTQDVIPEMLPEVQPETTEQPDENQPVAQ